jgi:amidase
VAANLRAAGALLLGKTSMSQWASFRSRPPVSGWSSRGGQVLGGYHARQDPSGSSSGSGVGVDLGLAAAALGTETDGSIISPSQRAALVGIKPTVGRTSRHLVVPISEHQDTVGPMARSVRDAARVLQAIAGVDPRDNYTEATPDVPFDFLAATERPSALRGARIGVAWDVLAYMNVTEPPSAIDAFRSALDVVEGQGATIVNVTFPAAYEMLTGNTTMLVPSADFLSNLAAYLAELTANPNDIHSLADLRAWTRNAGDREGYPEHNTAGWDEVLDVQGWNNTDPRFWPAYQHNLEISGPGGLLGALDRHNLSAVMLPTSMSLRWAALPGAPVITVPFGFYPTDTPVFRYTPDMTFVGPKIPFGMSFLGRLWGEEELFALAHSFELKTGARGKVKPWIVPNIEIGDIAGF